MKNSKGYGVLCFIQDKFITIQRKNSIACVDILMGNFSTFKELKELAYNLTPEELLLFKTKDVDTLERTFMSKVPLVLKKNFDFIVTLLKCIHTEELYFQDTEILLPKGRPKRNELSLQTAKREFYEETGLVTNTKFYNGFVLEEYPGPNNTVIYSNTYYITKLKRFKPNFSCRETKKVHLLDSKDFYDKVDPRRKELRNLVFILNKRNNN